MRKSYTAAEIVWAYQYLTGVEFPASRPYSEVMLWVCGEFSPEQIEEALLGFSREEWLKDGGRRYIRGGQQNGE